MTESGDTHTFDNSYPMTAVRVAGTAYAAGSVTEIAFSNTFCSLTTDYYNN